MFNFSAGITQANEFTAFDEKLFLRRRCIMNIMPSNVLWVGNYIVNLSNHIRRDWIAMCLAVWRFITWHVYSSPDSTRAYTHTHAHRVVDRFMSNMYGKWRYVWNSTWNEERLNVFRTSLLNATLCLFRSENSKSDQLVIKFTRLMGNV